MAEKVDLRSAPSAASAPDGSEATVQGRFERIAARFPGRPALRSGDAALTYEELHALVHRTAVRIAAAGPDPGPPVGVLAENNLDPIAGVLGVLAANRPFVLLDRAHPPARLLEIIADAGIRLLVAGPDLLDAAGSLAERTGAAVVPIAGDPAAPASPGSLGAPAGPDDLAAILYTSGSMGRPKGVCHTHRSLLHAVRRSTEALEISAEDRWLLLANLAHAGGINGLLRGLLNGACVLHFRLRTESIAALVEFARRECATVLHAVPSVFRLFARGIPPGVLFPDLRLLLVGGEALFESDFELFKEHFGSGCILVNHLGCTEISGYAQGFFTHDSRLAGGVLPVGRPPEGVRLSVVDDAGRPALPGAAGTVVVESEFLAAGYWNLTDLTRERFAPVPGSRARCFLTGDRGRLLPDGRLVFLGRADDQVKVRGHRVEPFEIERALWSLGSIENAAVVARQDAHGRTVLAAYLASSAPLGTAGIRSRLEEILPSYMVPHFIVRVEKIPLTPTGKVDRAALPPPPRTRPEVSAPFRQPEPPYETAVAALWEAVLGLDRLGADDPFHDLGGDSLSAARILQRAASAGLGSLRLTDFYTRPTIAGMAALLNGLFSEEEPVRSLEQALEQLEDF